MSFQTTALLLSWVAILLLAMVVAGLVRQVHALAQGAPQASGLGPAPGSRAPEFDRVGHGLLLFLDRDCGTCADVLTAAEALHTPAKAIFAGQPPETTLPAVADAPDLFDAYGVPATPFAVVVDPTGRVRAAEPVGSTAALHDLLDALEGAEVRKP